MNWSAEERWEPPIGLVEMIPVEGPTRVYDASPTPERRRPAGFTATLESPEEDSP